MMGKRKREETERIKRLKELVKAGNLPYFDPLVDGKLSEFDRALSEYYQGFKVVSTYVYKFHICMHMYEMSMYGYMIYDICMCIHI